jgi:glutamate-1-semialdehyde 2,1-aminomutase
LGPAYQAGTLSGNPLAVSAGIACLKELAAPGVYDRLEELGAQAEQGLLTAADATNTPLVLNRVGSMFTAFFTKGPVTTWGTAADADTERYGTWFHGLLERGVYVAPSQFEAGFVSLAHSAEDLAFAAVQAREAMAG